MMDQPLLLNNHIRLHLCELGILSEVPSKPHATYMPLCLKSDLSTDAVSCFKHHHSHPELCVVLLHNRLAKGALLIKSLVLFWY